MKYISILSALLITQTALAHPFTDITPNHRATPALNYMHSQNIIKGTGENTFHPDYTVSRAEFLKMLFKTTDTNLIIRSPRSFPDLEVTDWASAYVHTAVALGIMNGHPNGNAYPHNFITQSEGLKLVNALNGKSNTDLTSWNNAFTTEYKKDHPLSRIQTVQLIYANTIEGTEKENYTYPSSIKNPIPPTALEISAPTIFEKNITSKSQDETIMMVSLKNTINTSLFVDEITLPPQSGFTNIRLEQKRLRGPSLPVDINIRQNQDEITIIPRNLELPSGNQTSLIVSADIDPTWKKETYQATYPNITLVSKHGSFMTTIKEAGPKLHLFDTNAKLPVDIEDFGVLRESQSKVVNNINIKPLYEDAVLEHLELSYTANRAQSWSINKLEIKNAWGEVIHTQNNIPRADIRNTIKISNLNYKLKKDVEHNLYIHAYASPISNNSIAKSGDTFEIELGGANPIIAYGENSGKTLSSSSFSIKSSKTPEIMTLATYPVITRAENTPRTIYNGTNEVARFNIQNPSNSNNLYIEQLRLTRSITSSNNSFEVNNLQIQDNRGARLADCTINGSTPHYICDFTKVQSQGFEIRKGTNENIKIYANVSGMGIVSDTLRITIPDLNNFYASNLTPNSTAASGVKYRGEDDQTSHYYVPADNTYLSSPLMTQF